MAKSRSKVVSKSAAPGQYLGYGLQDVRLCNHLLRAPAGTMVSLEYLDDTAVHGDTGFLLEQAKSALKGNPISDSANDLWKTFATWGQLCAEGKVDAATTRFRLYVSPQKPGDIVQKLHSAIETVEIDKLLERIAKRVKADEEEVGCNPEIIRFLAYGPEICRQIILHFELLTEADPIEPIREVLRFAVHEDSMDDFCAYAIGMAKNEISELIRAKVTPVLAVDKFKAQLHAFIRKNGALGLLVPTMGQPTSSAVSGIVEAAPIFVQQLLKVEMSQDQLLSAVSDYLRSDADRTVWAADGKIVEESLDELNSALEAHFKNARDEVEDLHSTLSDEKRGRQVYRMCIKSQEPLEGRPVPQYFITGTFNYLANTVRIGWHPIYNDFFTVV